MLQISQCIIIRLQAESRNYCHNVYSRGPARTSPFAESHGATPLPIPPKYVQLLQWSVSYCFSNILPILENQEQRNAIELATQLQSAAASLYSESVNMEGRLEDFSSTANAAHDVSSLRGGYSASLNGVGGIHDSFSLFDSNSRHDHFVGLDANGNCMPYALSEPVPSTISTSPGNSSPLDVLGSGRMQHRNSSPAHSDNYFSSEDHLLESAIIATNDLMKTTNFGSPDLSSADASPRASDSCAMSDPGWLSALHMAARRGHGGIVRLCKWSLEIEVTRSCNCAGVSSQNTRTH